MASLSSTQQLGLTVAGASGGGPADFLLSGQAAEQAGMWLTAATAVITLVAHSCK